MVSKHVESAAELMRVANSSDLNNCVHAGCRMESRALAAACRQHKSVSRASEEGYRKIPVFCCVNID